ncbi:hypothetical protein SAMN04490244_101246 [Tranquillimonas rosea]|uniref:Uncharacterized protein n=1 Tax=Tranquillimonas rosea TaxID=641238 RepID=A0A1H9PLF2_9RHOB|nr:hypothetical protein SAMN04490244_101246 [Tranquillimonas rosea]
MSTLQPEWMRRDYATYLVLAAIALIVASYFATPYLTPGATDAPSTVAPSE